MIDAMINLLANTQDFGMVCAFVVLCNKVRFCVSTVLPAKSDSYVIVYKVMRDLESTDHLCINPIHRIGLMHK